MREYPTDHAQDTCPVPIACWDQLTFQREAARRTGERIEQPAIGDVLSTDCEKRIRKEAADSQDRASMISEKSYDPVASRPARVEAG